MYSFAKLFKSDKNNYWILYYLMLWTIQALWTDKFVFPPASLRLGMVVAMFLPLYWKREMALIAIPSALLIRGQLSTEYSYLPDVHSTTFYIAIELFAVFRHRLSLNYTNIYRARFLLYLGIFIAIIDLLYNNVLGNYSLHILIGILLLPFFTEEKDLHIFSSTLFLACFLLAVYYIVMFDDFLTEWDDGMERSGWNDPNYFSTLLDVGFLLAILYIFGILKSNLWPLNRIVLILGMGFISAAVVMTASRAGFICMGVVLLIAIFFSRIKTKYLLLAIIFVFVFLYYLYNKGLLDVLLYRLLEEENIESGGNRTTIWLRMFSNYEGQPILSQYFGEGYMYRKKLTNGSDLHNEFLAVWADYGYIGELFFLCFVLSMFKFKVRFVTNNVAPIFYIFSILSLSPFQYVNVVFLVIWIYVSRWYESELKTKS